MSCPSPTSNTQGFSARRTESLDAKTIEDLADEETATCYGRVNVIQLIEKANLAISLVDENNDLIGHASFYEKPHTPLKVNERNHTEWLHKFYQLPDCDGMNTLFLHYFVAKSGLSEIAFSEIMKTVFNAVPFLHFVVFTVPKGTEKGVAIERIFSHVDQMDEAAELEHDVFVCHRHSHCPVLHIRGARVEDHDDLMPIFNLHNKHLNEKYGDFFLADMIEAQDDENKCIVADVDNTAVGFMSLCTEVNTQLLVNSFQLGVFNDLKCKKKVPIVTEAQTEAVTDEETRSDSAAMSEKSSSQDVSQKNSIVDGSTTKLSSQHLTEGAPAEFQSSPGSSPTKEPTKKAPAAAEPEYELIDMESVLCIQLFCIDSKYETRSLDFLPKVFELFPKKDFVVMTVPHTVPEFPLLQMFQRVTPKPESTLSQELYIFNKNGLLNKFHVRFCEPADMARIERLSSGIHGQQHLVNDVDRYLKYQRDADGTFIKCYVAEVMHQVVGVCVLRQEQDTEYLRAHFNIEDFVYFSHHERGEHANLYHFVLNPIFQHYSKYFLKEVLYLSEMSCLYYPMYPDYATDISKPHSLVTCLNDLVPISARRQPIYPLEQLGINAPVDALTSRSADFALYHLNRKLTLEPKVVINIRIVIVGASDVGLALLESLVFCPHLCFTNLTLVTEHGLDLSPDDETVNAFLTSRLCFSHKDLIQLSLKTWVNVIAGKMTGIDRKSKSLLVDGDRSVPYDELVLCTGRQYQTSVPTGADIAKLVTTSEAHSKGRKSVHRGFTPDAVFTINYAKDVHKVAEWVQSEFMQANGCAIIYGNSIEAYTCVNGLLSLGVPGDRLMMIQPPSELEDSPFNNSHIDKALKQAFKDNGITCLGSVPVHHNYTLAQWNHARKDRHLKVATFTSDAKPLEVDCEAFFCFDNRTVDYEAFKAMNNCCLVFDGRLVIDKYFRTNDPSILAAGSLTKFVRRYHDERWSHENFNSKEIGQKLANTILQVFDPTLIDSIIEENPGEENLIPSYREAKSVHAHLPGGLHYLHIGKPSTVAAFQSVMSESDLELITGDVLKGATDYFRVHINQYSKIETITCLSRKPLKASNYVCLYDIHERYLNNLLQRFQDDLIADFYKYFDEAWCLAFFHDRFLDFRAEIRELMAKSLNDNQTSLEERVSKLIQEDLNLSSSQRSHLQDNFTGGGYKSLAEKRMISFLAYNQYHLPMYARPGLL